MEVISDVKNVRSSYRPRTNFWIYTWARFANLHLTSWMPLQDLKNERKVIANSFIYSDFNGCLLIWMLASAKSIPEIGNLQRQSRAICFFVLFTKFWII